MNTHMANLWYPSSYFTDVRLRNASSWALQAPLTSWPISRSHPFALHLVTAPCYYGETDFV